MADDLCKTGAADRRRINVHQRHEVRYWTRALGISADALRAVVKHAGTLANKVRDALRGQGHG